MGVISLDGLVTAPNGASLLGVAVVSTAFFLLLHLFVRFRAWWHALIAAGISVGLNALLGHFMPVRSAREAVAMTTVLLGAIGATLLVMRRWKRGAR